MPHTESSDQVLALLLGVNIGPTVLVTGSLSGLLWARRRTPIGPGRPWPRYALPVGLIAGVPALLAAVTVLSLT